MPPPSPPRGPATGYDCVKLQDVDPAAATDNYYHEYLLDRPPRRSDGVLVAGGPRQDTKGFFLGGVLRASNHVDV